MCACVFFPVNVPCFSFFVNYFLAIMFVLFCVFLLCFVFLLDVSGKAPKEREVR